MTRTVQVDRFEGEFAVLLDGDTQVDVPASWLPPGTREGASLTVELLAERSSERLQSGEDCRISGQYEQRGPNDERDPGERQITAVEGKKMPPTRDGWAWVLVDETQHAGGATE